MKSFDEATNQVAGLMAAAGGNVDAYEDEQSSAPTAPAVPSTPCFDAAIASVEAHIQHNEPKRPQVSTSSTVTDTLAAIEKMNSDLDGVTESPFEPDPAEEELFDLTTEEAEISAKLREQVPEVDCDDKQADGKFWMCMLEDVYIPQAPLPVEPCYKYLSSVYADGCEELMEIYQAFTFAIKSGEPQTVTIDSGTYEMTQGYAGSMWELNDTGKGRKYCQEAVWQQTSADPESHYDLVEEEDLFIWVIPEDREDVDDLGYLHNQWVFLRE